MRLRPGTRLGPYEILAPLGAGGMGEVYRATDTKLGREVAIKTLPPEVTGDSERLARFQRGAHLLASLNHPHIAAIYGLEEADGKPFLVLEPILENRSTTWADAQRLTHLQGRPGNVSLSPDKSEVVFSVRRPKGQQIWKVSAGGGDPQHIVMGPREQVWPRWSPDGQSIAFHSVGDIWVVSRTGAPATQLTDVETFDGCPSWSPDGREIGYSSVRGRTSDVWIVPAQGGEARRLTNNPAGYDFPGAWSPDGLQVAFVSRHAGGTDIRVISSAGGEPRQLASNAAFDAYGNYPFWSPDGQWVIFKSDRAGRPLWRIAMYFAARRGARANLYVRETGTKTEHQLTDFVGKPGYLASLDGTDGEFLYFTWREDHGDLWVMDVEQQGAGSQ